MQEDPRSRSRAVVAVVAVGCFEIAAIALLHRMGHIEWMTVPRGSLQSWLAIAPIEDVAAAGLRSIALVIAYWVAASTAAYGAARISRIPGLIRATTWATLPPIRRSIDRAIAATFTAAALASPLTPVMAGEIPSPPEPVVFQLSDHGIPTPVHPPAVDRSIDPTVILPPGVGNAGYTPRPAGGVALDDATDNTEVAGAVLDSSADEKNDIHNVAAGDNLWTITAAHLRLVYPNRELDAAEIAPYWRRVIKVNTPTLRSGNPNLIYPGEEIVLPHPGAPGDT